MTKQEKIEQLRQTIKQAFDLLNGKLHFSQRIVVDKLDTLHCEISTATLHNIISGKTVGVATLNKVENGILEMVHRELGLMYNHKTGAFSEQEPNWKPDPIPEKIAPQQGIHFHQDGRVSIDYKTRFIADAKQDIIEVGLRLSNFSRYFKSQSEKTYKAHIVNLLKRGVNISGYLIDPGCQEARLYFEDRQRVQPEEKDSIAEIYKVIERLQSVSIELKNMSLPGKFEIFTYTHVPYNLFYAVDGNLNTGKIMVAPYLYGIERANCPVIEANKKDQPALFRMYWDSLQKFTKGAKKI
jgi:hypothetical protein